MAEEEALESSRERSSKCQRAHPQGFFLTPSPGMLYLPHVPVTTAPTPITPGKQSGTPNIFMQWMKMPLGSPPAPKPMHPPRFVEIAKSLWGDNSPHITIDLPQLTPTPGLLVGTTMTAMMTTQL